MIPPFDIFRVEEGGHILWLEHSGSLPDAKARIAILGSSRPGEYLIFSQKTGNKISIVAGKSEKPD